DTAIAPQTTVRTARSHRIQPLRIHLLPLKWKPGLTESRRQSSARPRTRTRYTGSHRKGLPADFLFLEKPPQIPGADAWALLPFSYVALAGDLERGAERTAGRGGENSQERLWR